VIEKAMNVKIKCHRPGTTYTQPHYFALNKGENTGKPLNEACPNCFVIIVDTVDQRDALFWLNWGMWQGKAFHPYLTGSVIAFIHIHDYKALITRAYSAYSNSKALCNKGISLLKDLSNLEITTKKKLTLMAQAKRSVYHKYIFAYM
jgi:hypothetical protein